MKYLTLFSLIFLMACNSTKPLTQNSTKETPVAVTKDSIKKQEQESLTAPKTLPSLKLETTQQPASTVKANKEKPELKKNVLTTHLLWDELLQNNVSESGQVNYKGFQNERNKLYIYLDVLSKAYSDKSFSTLSKEKKLAFWINAYNAMTVDLILRNYPIKSIKDIDKPWDQRFWKLGSKWFNLNEIEHEILRKMNEPRIHFTIVCASVSCPKLQNKAFTASKLETQLIDATTDFLSDLERNELSENSIKISKIFQWFSKDFKQDGSLIDFLNQYSNVDISAKAKKTFKDYNWDLNE